MVSLPSLSKSITNSSDVCTNLFHDLRNWKRNHNQYVFVKKIVDSDFDIGINHLMNLLHVLKLLQEAKDKVVLVFVSLSCQPTAKESFNNYVDKKKSKLVKLNSSQKMDFFYLKY